jgi:hypothetical protein
MTASKESQDGKQFHPDSPWKLVEFWLSFVINGLNQLILSVFRVAFTGLRRKRNLLINGFNKKF